MTFSGVGINPQGMNLGYVKVSSSLLFSTYIEPVMAQLRIVDVKYDFADDAFTYLAYHRDFAACKPGSLIPFYDFIITRKEDGQVTTACIAKENEHAIAPTETLV